MFSMRRSALVSSSSVGVALIVIACGGRRDAGNVEPGEAEDTGRASIALAVVPVDVACIQITAQGSSRTEVDSFDVTPSKSAVLKLHGLPTGIVVFSGQAFGTSCSSLTASTVANYIADPVSASISTSTPTSVTLSMRKNGLANVTVDFEDGDAGSTGTDAGTASDAGQGTEAGSDASVPNGDAGTSDGCTPDPTVCNNVECGSVTDACGVVHQCQASTYCRINYCLGAVCIANFCDTSGCSGIQP